jgi:hypothetical protein
MNEEVALAIEELRQRPTDRAWFRPFYRRVTFVIEALAQARRCAPSNSIDLSTEWRQAAMGFADAARMSQEFRIQPSCGELVVRAYQERYMAKLRGSGQPGVDGNAPAAAPRYNRPANALSAANFRVS